MFFYCSRQSKPPHSQYERQFVRMHQNGCFSFCDKQCIFPYQSGGNCAIGTAGLTQDQFARRCAERGRGLDITEVCP